VIITSTGMYEPILDRHLFEPVLDGVRKHLALLGEESTSIADRDLIERYLERVIAKPQALELCLLPPREVSVPGEETNTCGSVI
jgi:hypothetical protein